MQRRFILALVTGLFSLTVLALLTANQASAGIDLQASEGFSNPHSASSFPTSFKLDIKLDGATVEQVDYIWWEADIGSSNGGGIGGANIRFYLDSGKAVEQSISYEQAGTYTIRVRVYNNTYDNGTEKPENEKMIQERTYPLTIIKKGGGDDDDTSTGLPFDITQMIYGVAVIVGVIIIMGVVRFAQSRGGLSMPSLPRGPLNFPVGKSPLGPPGGPPLSSLGNAHSDEEEAKGPVAKRDCPTCKTPIPIETEERPLKITCPNENCGKSFTLKAKSGAVPSKSPARPKTKTASKAAGKTTTKTASPKGKRPRRTSAIRSTKPQRPKGPGPAAGKVPSPPRPRTPAKGKPPAPKPKPLHCPNDGSELDFYPGAAKQYGYDSDYFCPKCELYVMPREKSGGKARTGKPADSKPTAPAKSAPKDKGDQGPFTSSGKSSGASPASKPKASPLPVPDDNGDQEGDTVTCPSCDKVHEIPDAMTKNLMCTCGRRIRVKR